MIAMKESRKTDPDRRVYTRLGTAKVIHVFPDGTIAVEYPWGGGEVLMPHEVRGLSHNAVRSYEGDGETSQC